MHPAIELIKLHKRYGQRKAVETLDITIEPGTVFGLIGPNGAGKTTTLRMILDIIRPTSGTVRIFGEEPRTAGAALRRQIGYIPGEFRGEGRSTGRQLLNFYASVSGPVTPGNIDRLATRLDLDLSRPMRSLSKGNKQKLGIVQAFMHDPPLLILDEPTSGLDPLMQREFVGMVSEARENGQTVLLSSHVLSEIQQTADTVAVLNHGSIVAEGDVASLRLGAIRRIRVGLVGSDEDIITHQLRTLPNVTDLDVRAGAGEVRVTATVEGEIDPVVKALAQHQVRDLTVEEPDLEESVLRLYGAPGRQGTGGRHA